MLICANMKSKNCSAAPWKLYKWLPQFNGFSIATFYLAMGYPEHPTRTDVIEKQKNASNNQIICNVDRCKTIAISNSSSHLTNTPRWFNTIDRVFFFTLVNKRLDLQIPHPRSPNLSGFPLPHHSRSDVLFERLLSEIGRNNEEGSFINYQQIDVIIDRRLCTVIHIVGNRYRCV